MLLSGSTAVGGVADPGRALGHHRRLGALGGRGLGLATADEGPQRLVVVLVRGLDDRDVGVALAQQASGDRDAGGAAADDQDLVLGLHGDRSPPLWLRRSGWLRPRRRSRPGHR